MKIKLNVRLILISIPLSYLLVRFSEKFVKLCPKPVEPVMYDALGCSFGFPLPHVLTGGFTGGGIVLPLLLANVVIITVVIYILLNFLYKKLK